MKLAPLAIGAGAGALAVLALAPATGTALGRLASARADHARLAALAATPAAKPVLLASGMAIRTGDAAGARGAMMTRIQDLAKAGGVLVEETSAVRAPDGVAALRVRVSGAEKAVVALADALERGKPMMRFRSWRIEPVPGGVRLIGDLVAAWE